MAGVQADAVIVLLEARQAQYIKDMEAAAKKTEDVFKRIRNANKPVNLSAAGGGKQTAAEREAIRTEGVIQREAAKTAGIKDRLAAKSADAAEKAEARKAAAAEKAAQRGIAAAEKQAATEVAADERAAASAATRTIQTPLGGGKTQAQYEAELARHEAAVAAIPPRAAALSSTSLSSGNVAGSAAVNGELAEQLRLRAALVASNAADTAAIQDQLFLLKQINAYKAAGLAETEAIAAADADLVAIETRRTAQLAEQTALQQKQLEGQIATNGARVSSGISGITAALIGVGSVAEISHLNDEYIKFSNSLKIAGVSASDFDRVQQHLLETATRTGTNIGSLSDTYRSIALASHDLGASQQDIIKVTDAVANSLRVTGASGNAARAAILQLGHSFETGRVTAREFNSLALNAYPILQAAAAGSDKYGGSVAKLRQALLDGDLSSKEFFNNILAGSDQLAERASKATLTTGQGFAALNSALVVYFGSADKAQGISALFGSALGALANNLNIVIPAIAAISAALISGYVVNTIAAIGSTAKLGSAILSAFGGPVGIAITAVTLAVTDFVIQNNNANASLQKSADGLKDLQDKYGQVANAGHGAAAGLRGVGDDALAQVSKINGFSGAVAGLTGNLLQQAAAARLARIALLDKEETEARSNQRQALARTDSGQAQTAAEARAALGRGNLIEAISKGLSNGKARVYNFLSGGEENQKAQREADNYGKQLGLIGAERNRVSRLKLGDPSDFAGSATTPPASGGKATKGAGSASSGIDRTQRYEDQVSQESKALDKAILSAKGKEAQGIEDKAKAAIDSVNAEYAEAQERYANIAKEKGVNTSILVEKAGQLRDLKIARINSDKQDQLDKQKFDIDTINKDAAISNKEATLAVTNSLTLRRAIEKQILDLKYAEKDRLADQAIKDAQTANDPKAEAQARATKAGLPGEKRAEVFGNNQADRTGYEKYRDNLKNTDSLSDELDRIKTDSLDRVADSLTNATTKALGLHGALGDIVSQIIRIGIERKLIGPLADALFGKVTNNADGSDTTSGGALGGLFSSLTGFLGGKRASGGSVSNGRPYLVGENGPELFIPAGLGNITPTGSLRAGSAGTHVTQYISVDGRNSVTPAGFASQILSQANAHANRAAANAGKAAYQQSPQRQQKLQQLGS